KRMKDEAAANAAADAAEKERIDKINKADAVIFQTEKQLKELGDKFAADKRAPIDAALNELKEAHKAQNVDAIDPAIEKLQAALQVAAQDIYNAQQGGAQPGGQPGQGFTNQGGAQGGNSDNGNVQDADYEEVK
ncbi:MAG: Hsp70 family protein, partial [Bacteroidales bacterium]|nr:Hsp70 family protein [Bacteroidales bacterium]